MADVHSKLVRSFNMKMIRAKDTKPEVLVRKFIFSKGFRYKLYDRTLPGRPDLVLPKYRTVLFVHGCFWHAHQGCKYFVVPKTRTDWWVSKLDKNRKNDQKHLNELKKAGWKVITIWECELRGDKLERTLASLIKKIG